MSSVNNSILAYVVDSDDFYRMQESDCYGINGDMTYAEFLIFNQECISKLTEEDHAWVLSLCQRIRRDDISLMDLESCSVFKACAIYYSIDEKLCIVNPR